MPAELVPDEAIPELASKMDAPMLSMLRLLRQYGFLIAHSPEADKEGVAALDKLVKLGLVDGGYPREVQDQPFVWVNNRNGEQVLMYVEDHQRYQIEFAVRAQTTLQSLSEAEREQLDSALLPLAMSDQSNWPSTKVSPLTADPPVFLLIVSADIRAFIRVRDQKVIEVVDIVREETIRQFLKMYGEGKAQ